MSEGFPTAYPEEQMQDINIHQAAEAARQQLESSAAEATAGAFAEGSIQNGSTDYGIAEFSEAKSEERNPDGTFTVKETVASAPSYESNPGSSDPFDASTNTTRVSTSTTESIAPAKGVFRKRPDMENSEATRTSEVESMVGHNSNTGGDVTTATFKEEKTGSTGRKITREVTVGTSKGEPTIRVALESHGPGGPEDKPRSRVIEHKDGAPYGDGVKRGEKASIAAIKTAEAVAGRVTAAQPKPKNPNMPSL